MKRTDFFESLRLRFPAMPRLAPAGGEQPMQFAASGGGAGGGGYDDDPDDYYDEYDEEPAPRRRDETERQPTAARRRTVQSEPDDRYWTDYLRIALPVIGLLLVIAVFWFWAQQLIDDTDEDLTPTEPPGVAEVVDSPTEPPTEDADQVVATPPQETEQQSQQQTGQQTDQQQSNEQPVTQPTQAPVVTPTPPIQVDLPDTDTSGDGTDNQVDEQPADEPAGGIAPDTAVVVSEDGLRMRSDPSTGGEIVNELNAGDELTVVSGPEEGESYIWWQVTDATGNIGWVAEDFIEPAG